MNKRIAEALVECGYAKRLGVSGVHDGYFIGVMDGFDQVVNPFIDTIESRRQADALEDWLFVNQTHLWGQSANNDVGGERRQWRLDRIKYCFEQMGKDNEHT